MNNRRSLFSRIVYSLAILLFTSSAYSQSVIGVWETIDDKTKKPRSHVEIYELDGKVYGKVVALLDKPEDSICEPCKGKKKNAKVIGMDIIEGLKDNGAEFEGGTIVDPENGKVYKCIIWLDAKDSNTLKVRGKHWTGLYRTQTWYRK